MEQFKVGIVGAGYVSGHHLRALKGVPSARVVAIVDVDLDRARQVAAQHGIPHAYASFSEIPTGQVNVVHVLTPPESHAAVALQALGAGCHVLVEKPMAESEEECRKMIEAARVAGRVLSVNHSARMDPVILQGMEIARSGALGEVVSVDFVRNSDYPPYRGGSFVPPPYRTGAYPFQDLGVHGISMIESFLGPARSCEAKYWHRGADINLSFDEWQAVVECEHGIGHMHLSWNSRPIRSEVFVHGTNGSLHIDCFLQTCQLAKTLPGPKFLTNVAAAIRGSLQSLWRVPWNVLRFATGRLSGAPGIHVSVQRFYDALRAGTPPPIPAEEGLRFVSVMAPIVDRANQLKADARKQALRPRPPASILVTGAGGFLGRRVVSRLLREGLNVRLLVRRAGRAAEFARAEVVEGDLGDPEIVDCAVQGVEKVIHVGAAMKGSAWDFERGTVAGTRNVVEACLRHGVKHMTHISSLSVLDHAGHKPGQLVTENSPFEPHPELRGAYTQTKLQAEEIVSRAVRERGLRAVILRPGQIFGPGSEHVAPPGVLSFGPTWIVVGNGKRPLPLVFVDDVVQAIWTAMQQEVSGVYNLVDTEVVDQRTYLRAVRERLGSSVSIHYVPEWLLWTAGFGCELLQSVLKRGLPLSRYRVRSIRPLSPFDVSAAARDLHWSPQVRAHSVMQNMETAQHTAQFKTASH